MEVVQPVRDPAMVIALGEALGRHSKRDRFLWILGSNTSYRVSDLLRLRVRDVWVHGIGQARTHLRIRAGKTGKKIPIALNPPTRQAIAEYCQGLHKDRYLFGSRKGSNRPITRKRAYEVIRSAGLEIGLEGLGTHSMRKTFGYHVYRLKNDVAVVQRLLGHSHPKETLRYIGVEQDEMDAAVMALSYDVNYRPKK